MSSTLVLNIIPITFSRETVSIGRVPFIDDEAYERAAELRDAIRSLRISKKQKLPGESNG